MSPEEFQHNLRSIAGRATKQGARVILLNPIANRHFPCGVGAANTTYFCYLDDLDRLGEAPANQPIDEISAGLAAGVRCFVSGDYSAAMRLWEPVASTPNVAGFIARHNLACARARTGEPSAGAQLDNLLGEFEGYDSTVLYNLAHVARSRGDEDGAVDLLERAFEKDASAYRVRQTYREAIAALAAMDGVRVVDLSLVLRPSHFVDYCHPTDEGHERIAAALADVIRADDLPVGRPGRSSYQVHWPAPDYARHPGQTLVDYYCIDWPISHEQVTTAMASMAAGDAGTDAGDPSEAEIIQCLENFFRANQTHPIFTDNMKLAGDWTPRSHEILSVPEQFLYRVLYNYSLAFEAGASANRLASFADLEGVRLSSSDYLKIILRANEDDLTIDLDLRREYYDAVVSKITTQLASASGIYRVTIGERIRTIMSWFTREAFRYGTQSRMSMLYARWDIERFVEGLTVAIVIAHARREWDDLDSLDALLCRVLFLVRVHERHARQYHDDTRSFSVDAYEADLADAERSIKAACDALVA